MTSRLTDGIRRACGIVEGMRDNEFAEATVRKASIAEACDRLDAYCEAARALAREEGRAEGRREAEAELAPRLMPEGMEWPTDAIGVRITPKETVWANGNDGGDGRAWYVESVSPGMSYSIHASDGAGNHRDLKPRWLTHEPPALKVLDADGVEIRKGDTVWHAEDGREGTVKQIVRAHDAQWNDVACVCVAFNGSSRDDYILPANLTHCAPVLAADGRPLREGETVWDTFGNLRFKVVGFEPLPENEEYAVCRFTVGQSRPTSPTSTSAASSP